MCLIHAARAKVSVLNPFVPRRFDLGHDYSLYTHAEALGNNVTARCSSNWYRTTKVEWGTTSVLGTMDVQSQFGTEYFTRSAVGS